MATSTADPEVFNVVGPPIKSAALDPLGRQGVVELFARRLVAEMGIALSAHAMDGTPLGAAEIGDDALIMVRTGGATSPTRLGDAIRSRVSLRGYITAADVGLVGDGLTDDAPALQRALDEWAAKGGAAFLLRAQDHKALLLRGRVRIPSACAVNVASPVKLGANGGFAIEGRRANALAGAAALLDDVTLGDNTIRVDTAGVEGGGPVSAHFAVGDRITLYSDKDSAGTVKQSAEHRVVGVVDATSTLTLSGTHAYLFRAVYPAGEYEAAWGTVDRTTIEKQIVGHLASDLAEGSTLVTLEPGAAARFVVGDLVTLEDDSIAADVAGASTERTRVEVARLAAPVAGDPAETVRLERKCARPFSVARLARIVKVAPVERATLAGAVMVFAESPALDPAPRINTVEVRYGVDCRIQDCSVPNKDAFGSRGDAFRLYRSLDCRVETCSAEGAKFTGPGEGYGLHFVSCHGCAVDRWRAKGMRHGIVWRSSTACPAFAPQISGSLAEDLAWQGADSVDCVAHDVTLTAGVSGLDNPERPPTAIVLGNTAILAGDRRCGVDGGRVIGYRTTAPAGSSSPAVRVHPPCVDCFVRGVEFVDGGRVLAAHDAAGFGSLVCRGFRLERCLIQGCSELVVDVNGRQSGAVQNAVVDLTVEGCTFRGCTGALPSFQNATEVQFLANVVDDCDPPVGAPYALSLVNVSGVVVRGNYLRGVRRGILVNAVADGEVLRNDFSSLVGDTLVLVTQGSNALLWARNEYGAGLIPTAGGSSVGVTIRNDDLPRF